MTAWTFGLALAAMKKSGGHDCPASRRVDMGGESWSYEFIEAYPERAGERALELLGRRRHALQVAGSR